MFFNNAGESEDGVDDTDVAGGVIDDGGTGDDVSMPMGAGVNDLALVVMAVFLQFVRCSRVRCRRIAQSSALRQCG